MPRAEVGSQKWLANKMKAKGLQKLKWYCQMCEKQCRDENGFKCHRLSEGHQRMMQVFCQNAGRFMDGFSKAFEHEFMKLMRTRYCKTKILANSVYQEVISDKEHVHMNATVWVTLSEFVLYLGRSGKCKVEDSPRGWMIEYIDQDQIRRDQDAEARRKREISLEQRHQKLIQKMIEDARKRGGFQEPEYTPLMKESDEKLRFETNLTKPVEAAPDKKSNVFMELCKKAKSTAATPTSERQTPSKEPPPKRKTAIETLMTLNGAKRQAVDKDVPKATTPAPDAVDAGASDKWLMTGIQVRVILQSHPLYKHKCRVVKIMGGGSRALIQDIEGSGNYQVDSNHVETVIPPVGSKVMVLRGAHRGRAGSLTKTRPDDLLASVRLDSRFYFPPVHLVSDGAVLDSVHYDDISRTD
ncbi:-DNA/RNA-binding protein KIN17 [Babesia bigemina]|uniref:-DNA/RNA-binding protein KIN17 n=1 Tax=Babesia bigemina TaxID=5866 RepID=A0A061DDZ7_BABBI|nr:-DNA/RNA-binding protein KIN17 [Babesia bigemina]CDR97819.1 -DNA/RNA-binding protein KIN17 [Babesia bigemina]|eukprot:XP_012770005.1 -DNA/RNA-binding protein KIN17 [Babesia bigemina]